MVHGMTWSATLIRTCVGACPPHRVTVKYYFARSRHEKNEFHSESVTYQLMARKKVIAFAMN